MALKYCLIKFSIEFAPENRCQAVAVTMASTASLERSSGEDIPMESATISEG